MSDKFNEAFNLLSKQLAEEGHRRSLVTRAFGDRHPIREKIRFYSDSTQVFVPLLIETLRAHGEIEDGTQAMWHFLLTLRETVGPDVQGRIDELQTWANSSAHISPEPFTPKRVEIPRLEDQKRRWYFAIAGLAAVVVSMLIFLPRDPISPSPTPTHTLTNTLAPTASHAVTSIAQQATNTETPLAALTDTPSVMADTNTPIISPTDIPAPTNTPVSAPTSFDPTSTAGSDEITPAVTEADVQQAVLPTSTPPNPRDWVLMGSGDYMQKRPVTQDQLKVVVISVSQDDKYISDEFASEGGKLWADNPTNGSRAKALAHASGGQEALTIHPYEAEMYCAKQKGRLPTPVEFTADLTQMTPASRGEWLQDTNGFYAWINPNNSPNVVPGIAKFSPTQTQISQMSFRCVLIGEE